MHNVLSVCRNIMFLSDFSYSNYGSRTDVKRSKSLRGSWAQEKLKKEFKLSLCFPFSVGAVYLLQLIRSEINYFNLSFLPFSFLVFSDCWQPHISRLMWTVKTKRGEHRHTFMLCKILLIAFNSSIYNVCHDNNYHII